MDANPKPNDPLTPAPAAPPAGWLKRNGVNLALGVVGLFVLVKYLNPLDVALAAGGLTLIIFLHELGHFAAAKLCKVRVEAFSIGFGPPLPFCSYTYGETTYKLCAIPLGGYVKMLGQTDGATDDEPDDDPKSFKNQSVGERMLIISAGVVMNLILGCGLFLVVYMHGLEEMPAVIATTEPGGAAWKRGLHAGTEITSIAGTEKPWFDDIRPSVWATDKGEQLPLTIRYAGTDESITAEPLQPDGLPYPVLGIRPPEATKFVSRMTAGESPTRVGSAAAAAAAANGEGFKPGDVIVAATDPADPARGVTPLTPKPGDLPGEIYVLHSRLAKLAAEPVTLHVRRKDSPADAPPVAVVVPPAFRKETGLRMRMGEVVATRHGSPADGKILPGDVITDAEIVAADGKVILFSAAAKPEPGKDVRPLDPLKLPRELNRQADAVGGTKRVKLTVLRDVDHTRKPVTVELGWDAVGRFDASPPTNLNAPLPVNGLGLAYAVQAVVDAAAGPAAAAGLKANDAITHVRYKMTDPAGTTTGKWEELKPNQWAYVDQILQAQAPFEYEFRVGRGETTVEIAVAGTDDVAFPVEERGFLLDAEKRVMKADNVGEAVQMGVRRTVRSIRTIYMNLYAMAFGRVSLTTMSGPITLARASYLIAGEDVYRLMLLLALISINLAVVNFLPIPVLDGGHMVFLTYEWLRGKPAPESVQTVLTFAGLGAVLLMMVFVVGLDVWRLITMYLARL